MRRFCWQHTSYPCLHLEVTLGPGCIHGSVLRDTLVVTAFRRICRLFVEVLLLQISQISVFSDSGSAFCLTLDLLVFGTALLPLLLNIRTLYWLPWRQLLKCMILCTTWQRFQPPASETTLWICVCVGGGGVAACQPASMVACAYIEINPENLLYQLLILIKIYLCQTVTWLTLFWRFDKNRSTYYVKMFIKHSLHGPVKIYTCINNKIKRPLELFITKYFLTTQYQLKTMFLWLMGKSIIECSLYWTPK
jgi:hypothetical protein